MNGSSVDLGVVWDRVVAALPEGARFGIQRRPDDGPYEAWAQSKDRRALGYGYGDTAVEALLKLCQLLDDAKV